MTKQIFVGDFETDPFQDKAEVNYKIFPLFINIQEFYEGSFYTFILKNGEDKDELKQFLRKCCSIRNPSVIYFHNLKFDFKFLGEFLPEEYERQIVATSGRILEIKLYKVYEANYKNRQGEIIKRKQRKYVLKIRDSLALLISKLDDIGKALHFPKGKINYTSEITTEFIEYGKQDCRILRLALNQLVEFIQKYFNQTDFSIDKMPLTLPSLAKKMWMILMRYRFGEDAFTFLFDQNSKKYEEYFRQFYFGGRVEVFDFNELYGAVYEDFNSFYLSIMHSNLFPMPPYHFYKCNNQLTCFKKIMKDNRIFGVIAEVTEDLDIPLCPIRVDNDKILYPIGKKTCFLFREEIEYLLNLNQKVHILSICLCQFWEDLFSEYAEKTYFVREQMKKQGLGDTFFSILLKYFGAQLYGKFAEHSEKEQFMVYPMSVFQKMPKEDQKKLTKLGLHSVEYGEETLVIVRKKTDMPVQINIFIAMRITALCRLELHKRIMQSEKCYYCDTDSLVVHSIIENSPLLGHLKAEFIAHKFQALGCKEYSYSIAENVAQYGNLKLLFEKQIVTKMKGFGKQKMESVSQFREDYLKPHRNFRPAGFFESINRQLDPGDVLVFEKNKNTLFDKRWVLEDLTTKPFDLQNENYAELIQHNQRIIMEKILSKV